MWDNRAKRWALDPERVLYHDEAYRMLTYVMVHESAGHLISNLVVAAIFIYNFLTYSSVLACLLLLFASTVIVAFSMIFLYSTDNNRLCGLSGTICAIIGSVLYHNGNYILLALYTLFGICAILFFPNRKTSHEAHFIGILSGVAYSVFFN